MREAGNEADRGCLEVVRIIERLLELRRRHPRSHGSIYRDSEHNYWQREWTHSELRDVVYPSYGALRRGKLKRPPTLTTLMQIADYLECTLEERNQLLTAARYAPIVPYLVGEALQRILDIAIKDAQYIPLPSYVVNRDWNILFMNKDARTFFGLDHHFIMNIPGNQMNILHLLFDPDLPIYGRMRHNIEIWDYIVRRNIYGFKFENILCQYDPWYQEHIESLMKLPEFSKYWYEVTLDSKFDKGIDRFIPFPIYITEMVAPIGKIVRFRSLLTSLGNYDYPQIVSYIPADEESRSIFTELGIPTPDNGWGMKDNF